MLLAVNIGNSNIRFAVMEKMVVKFSWTIHTKPYKTASEFYMIFQSYMIQNQEYIENISEVVIGSVVPHQTQVITKVLKKILKVEPFLVTRNTPSEVKHSSNQMGTDLYANAVAAHYLYPNKKKIIVDFGTALTLTGIEEDGQILGVIIAPGVVTSLNALVSNTAQLPDIELKKPKSTFGMDTETCMQSGIIYGYIAMVEGLISRAKKEYKSDFLVIGTGGVGDIYAALTESINLNDKYHTIKGLAVLYYLQKQEY